VSKAKISIREKYLEAALIMDQVLDKTYFDQVRSALANEDEEKGFEDFKEICLNKMKISKGAVQYLWSTLKGVYKKIENEPGWIIF
jgi:hypothetical protein